MLKEQNLVMENVTFTGLLITETEGRKYARVGYKRKLTSKFSPTKLCIDVSLNSSRCYLPTKVCTEIRPDVMARLDCLMVFLVVRCELVLFWIWTTVRVHCRVSLCYVRWQLTSWVVSFIEVHAETFLKSRVLITVYPEEIKYSMQQYLYV